MRLIQDSLSISATRFPDKVALIHKQKRWTYTLLDQYSNHFAHTLIQMGLQREDRVVIFLNNSAEIVISLYGILKADGVFVIVNGSIKSKKLAYILKDSGARFLITDPSRANIVANAFDDLNLDCLILWNGKSEHIPNSLTSISVTWDAIFKHVNLIDPITPQNIDVDLAALIYTSGSTGEPKGVMSPHYSMIAAATSITQYLENTSADIILNVLPLSFDYGLYQILMAFMFGGTVVLEESFVFIHEVLKRIPEEKVTGFPIVPTILAMILKLQNLEKYDFGSLRYITNTGAALPVEHIRKLRSLFPDVKIYSMFGLTECKRVCYLPPEELDKKPSSVGKAMPNCEVFIVDEAGNEVKPCVEGELVIRGSNVMRGYWNAPELSAKYFRPGRFPGEMLLYSGDYFKKDENGYLYFIGRKDDMIKSKGERLSAKEIENTIYQFDGVSEVAVFGVPDEIFGQAIKAVIVTEISSQISEKDILKFCTENLEPFAIPKYIEFVDELPKTTHGKIDKKSLKERHV